MALGDFKQTAESLGRSQTNSGTYATKLQLATPAVDAGTYLIAASFLYQTDLATLNNIQVRLVQDIGGVPVVLYETSYLRSADPGSGVGDAVEAATFEVVTTFAGAAAPHTFDLQYHVVGFPGFVTIEQVRLQFFKLDGTYVAAATDAHSFTNSTTYQLKTTLTQALAAGKYRLGMQCEYNNINPTARGGLRYRMRRDPAGANVITNLLGGNAGSASELMLNQGGYGGLPLDPHGYATYSVACLTLDANTYTFELHYRAVDGAFNDMGISLARLNLWRTG